MSTPEKVLSLVEVYDRNAEDYQSARFNEAMLRQQFVNPLFKSLGWDMDNEQGYAEAYKDVIHEAAIKIGGATKAPDYSFRIGGTPKFYLEAKKPSVNIKDDPAPAFQLRRYAWSAKMPLSILTNFKEFAVYDSRVKPAQTDKASTARILYLRYTDFAASWDEKIAGIFARESVLKGSFDKFADAKKGRKGTATVDAAFLDEIETWREELAKNLALRNPELSSRELNFAVQITIDRIIFLRMCEDRGIEPYGQLQKLQSESDVYAGLRDLYRKADERYNSGLFHFHKEKDRDESHDDLTPRLKIDDKILKSIFRSLYLPDSPYEFSVLPVEILGQVYEQFLGKVIRLTASHQAKVEEKPEVKKAGGVYYTPSYIVDYIVQHTVGRLLEGKTPKEAARLTVLDPACGSGSFLLGAYRHLLEWHLKHYEEDGPAKHKKEVFQAAGGVWRLTTAEKKRILLNNIYGVDIDPQAVEVTKLSLLLKVLEGESQQTLETQLKLFHERALPDLASNIKCGNSLIGPDFYEGRQTALFDEEERYRINVFDWNTAFPKIMKAGGFDAVIGNPPYIRIQTMKEWAPLEVEFYKQAYESASQGNYDIYVVFVEKGVGLLRKEGRLGFILPHKFFASQYGEPLREMLAKARLVDEVVHFGHQQVFVGATTYTCLLLLSKTGNDQFRIVNVSDLTEWQNTGKAERGSVPVSSVGSAEWNFAIGSQRALFQRLSQMPTKLGNAADIFVGLQTSADDVYIMDLIELQNDTVRLYSKALGSEWSFERALLFPLASGTDVKRYRPLPNRQYILFPYTVSREKAELIDFTVISRDYPRTSAYFLANKARLENRERGKFHDKEWHRFGRNQNLGIQRRMKLCVPRLVVNLFAAFDAQGGHFLDNVDVGGVTLKEEYLDHGLHYILGLLNSKVLRWYFPQVSAPFRGGWLSANRQFLSRVPIRTIDGSIAAEKALRDTLVQLVEHMLSLHEQLASARAPHDKTVLQGQMDATDRQIDRLVYDLYGLTEEEIRIVEESGG